MRQNDGESLDHFLDRYEEAFKTAEAAAVINCLIPQIQRASEKYSGLSDDEWVEAVKAVTFFLKANKKLFGPKLREVSEAVVLGVDNYPTTIDQAYSILRDNQQRMNIGRTVAERRISGEVTNAAVLSGTTNFQRRSIPDGENVVMGTDRRVYNVQCNNCNAWGHYSRECPHASSTVSIHSNKSYISQVGIITRSNTYLILDLHIPQ